MTLPAVDADVFAKFADSLGKDLELIGRVVEAFLDELRDDVDRMGPSLGDQDWETLRRCAHNLKSSAAAMGAGALANECNALELAAKGHDVGASGTLIARIEAEREAVREGLRALI